MTFFRLISGSNNGGLRLLWGGRKIWWVGDSHGKTDFSMGRNGGGGGAGHF